MTECCLKNNIIIVKEVIKSIILEATRRKGVNVVRILLFGSRAKGKASPESDWDIMVITKEKLSFNEKWEIIDEIKRKLARLKIPNDIIFKSQEEFEKEKEIPGLISYEVNVKGIKL